MLSFTSNIVDQKYYSNLAQTKAIVAQNIVTNQMLTASVPPSYPDLANEAYLGAIRYLKDELRGNEKLPEILSSHITIEDIKDSVNKAKEKYERLSKEKNVQRWLRAFSARIIYYGQVLDVLSQHHPEYVALAWGTVKFVLMVCHFPPAVVTVSYSGYVTRI